MSNVKIQMSLSKKDTGFKHSKIMRVGDRVLEVDLTKVQEWN